MSAIHTRKKSFATTAKRLDSSPPRTERGDRDRPYARYAFLNPYNLSLSGGLVVGGLLSGHHWLVVLACGAEVLWLILAPDSRLLQRVWFDPAFARAERAFDEERCRVKMASLAPADRERLTRLEAQQALIE